MQALLAVGSVLILATGECRSQERPLAKNELRIKNPHAESFTLWVWCYKHDRKKSDWVTHVLRRKSTFRREFHPGRFRFVLQKADKSFFELDKITFDGQPVDRLLDNSVACPACEPKDIEPYRCPHCGKIHHRVINKRRQYSEVYRLVDPNWQLGPIPDPAVAPGSSAPR